MIERACGCDHCDYCSLWREYERLSAALNTILLTEEQFPYGDQVRRGMIIRMRQTARKALQRES